MDTEILVGDRIDEGRLLIADLARDGFELTAAFWLRISDGGVWQFFIVSPATEPGKISAAYATLLGCLNRFPYSSIRLSDVMFLPPSAPAAKAVVALRDRYRRRLPIRMKEGRFGNFSFEEAYIYPREGLMGPDEVMQAVLGLMNRTGPVQPSKITLRDGSVVQAIPTGIQARKPGEIQIALLDVGSGAQRDLGVEEIVNIQ